MRRAAFALLFALPSVRVEAQPCDRTSSGPCMPTDFESRRGPIMKAIREGLGAESTMSQNLRLRDFAAAEEDDGAELAAWTAARAAELQMRRSFDLAIRLTIDAYRMAPAAPENPRVAPPQSPEGRWTSGLGAPWSATFALPQYRTIRGSDDKPHHLSDDPTDARGRAVGGLTDPDGKSFIFLPAMAWSSFADHPGLLASAIHHESRHYIDLITTGWDTHEGGELRANRATLATLDLFVPETSPDGKVRIKAAFARVLDEAIAADQEAIDSGKTHSPYPTPSQESEYAIKERAAASIDEEFTALQSRVRNSVEGDRNRLAAAQREARWAQFRLWTLYACEYIDGVHEGDPEWGAPDRIRARDEFLRGYLADHLVVMEKTEIADGVARGDLYRAGALGRCQRSLVTMIQDLPGPVDGGWLIDRIEFEKNGGRSGEIISRLIESIRRAVVDGTAGLIETTTSPFVLDRGGTEGGTERPGNDDPATRERPSRTPDIDKLPWQQLRGISAHGW